jgi:hypothetical protein
MLAPAELLILLVLGTIWVAALVTAIRSPRVPQTARLPWTVLIVLTNVVGAMVFFGWLLVAHSPAAPQS